MERSEESKMIKKIIAMIGVSGAGKTYHAEEMKRNYEKEGVYCELIYFADSLREILWNTLGWTPKDEKEYELFKRCEFSIMGNKTTGREMLQKLGTESLRAYDQDIWLKMLLKKVETSTAEVIIIPDCRFVNELRLFLQQKGPESFLGDEG